ARGVPPRARRRDHRRSHHREGRGGTRVGRHGDRDLLGRPGLRLRRRAAAGVGADDDGVSSGGRDLEADALPLDPDPRALARRIERPKPRGTGSRTPGYPVQTSRKGSETMRLSTIFALAALAAVIAAVAASAATGTTVTWRKTPIGNAITTSSGHTLYLF